MYRSFAVLALLAAGMSSAVAAPTHLGDLRKTQPLFWNGPPIAAAAVSDPSQCDIEGPCPEWTFTVQSSPNGGRVRVALDLNDLDDFFSLELYDPAGTLVASDFALYSVELFAPSAVGTWRVRAIPGEAASPEWRLRAALEGPANGQGPVRQLLPNLRMQAPFQLTFRHSPRVGPVPRHDEASCQAAETAATGAVKCLRLAFGPQNPGDGPFEVILGPLEADATGSLHQRIYSSDGSFQDRPAGRYEFHAQHVHNHMQGYARMTLWKVVDPMAGTLAQAGTGSKVGFCIADFKLADWTRFYQALRGTNDTDTCFPTDHMGISTGWGDVYVNSLEGNYVDFGANTDGLYVLRVEVDPTNIYLETNESDNASYAYVRVTDAAALFPTVEVLERGIGLSPWDPAKVVVGPID